jgi:hypothetical protein
MQIISLDKYSFLDIWHGTYQKKQCTKSNGLNISVSKFDWWENYFLKGSL